MPYRFIKPLFLFFLSVIIFCTSPDCIAQSAPQRLLLALSKSDHILAIVDPSTLKVMARVPVGADPHEVIASSDGNRAYVSNMGGGRFHVLNVIDLTTRKALDSIDTGPLTGLHGLAYTGGKLWFTAEGAKAIGRYDPTTAKVDWVMGTGQDRTHMIYVAPDEQHIYTTNVASGTVSVLEHDSLAGVGWIQTIIPVAKGSEGFDVTPDGRKLWTVASENGSIWIIDLTSKKVEATIDANINGANRLKITPDGKEVLISSLRIGDLFIYDAVTHKEVKRVPVGHGAAGILIDPIGNRAFVSCTPDNYIAVIDLHTLTVTGHLDIGGGPDGLAWAVRP